MRRALLLWCAACSLFALLLFAWDKAAARRGARRVPESRLLGLALLGGARGVLLGMILFRHKTRKAGFWILASLGLGLLVGAWLALV